MRHTVDLMSVSFPTPEPGPFRTGREGWLDALPIGAVVLDAGGHVLFANRSWLDWAHPVYVQTGAVRGAEYVRLLGEVAGVSAGQRAGFVQRLMSVVRGQSVGARVEVVCTRGEGRQWLALEIRALPEGDVLVTQIPITARRELERERDRFTALAEMLGHCVFQFEAGGKIVSLNSAARTLAARLGTINAAGKVVPNLEQWPGGLIGKGALATALVADDWRGPLFLDAIDGSTIAVDAAVHVHRGAGGEVEYSTAVLHDGTEDQRRERDLRHRNVDIEIAYSELKDAQEQLLQSEKMASIGQLAAGVAHEINNPIGYVHSNLGTLNDYVLVLFAVIEGYERVMRVHSEAEVVELRRRYDLEFVSEDLPMLLSESRDGIERVKKIVQDLKDFSYAERNEEWSLADLHKGLDSTLNIVSNELKYKAELIKDYGELPLVECFPMQLNQVFMNLLVNAGDAIRERGTITIATRVEGECAVVAISDTGGGMSPAVIARIFDPFYTTKPVGKGTGLGLSLAYGIVHKHNGRIEVESEPGVGTTFRVVLPLLQACAGAPITSATGT